MSALFFFFFFNVASFVVSCSDEPEMKATFSITVRHPSDFVAISNQPALQSGPSDEPGWTVSRSE
jgi:aminopeptidase N